MGNRNGVDVRISANWNRWVEGFDRLDRDMTIAARDRFGQAGNVFYDRSQQYVHVLSGNLLASGRMTITASRGSVVAELRYDTPYAMAEQMRGGSHAYITRAWQATESLFREALPEAWEEVVMRWR